MISVYLINYVLKAVCIIIVITFHGFLTALTSRLMGDKTNSTENMLTLNPIKHFEPLGFLLFLFFGFGWGQPVKASSYNYKNRKTGLLMTGLVPIAAGVVLGAVLILIAKPLSYSGINWAVYAVVFAGNLGTTALNFALFNIIPIYPLSGSKILTAILSPNGVVKYTQMENILQIILMIAIIMGLLKTPLFLIDQFVSGMIG